MQKNIWLGNFLHGWVKFQPEFLLTLVIYYIVNALRRECRTDILRWYLFSQMDASEFDLLNHIAQLPSMNFADQYYPDFSGFLADHLLMDYDEEDIPDFTSDTLFSSLSQQLFAFPNPKEICKLPCEVVIIFR